MSSNENLKWYSKTKELCFAPELKVPDSAFLSLFAPHCVARNANFFKKDERKGGVAAANRTPSEEEIWKRQIDFLQLVGKVVNEHELIETTIKIRSCELSCEIIENNLSVKADKEFARKNASYKKSAYLNLYLVSNELSAEEIFAQITNLYADVLGKIYFGYDAEAETQLKALKVETMMRAPELQIDENSGKIMQMAQCVAALLFLDAEPDKYTDAYCNMRHALFGLPIPNSAATLSIPTIESVTLKTEQYIRMCRRVLASNPEYADLEMIHSHLMSIRKKSNGLLDGEFGFLAQELKNAVNRLGNETFREIVECGGFPGTLEQQKLSQELSRLLVLCDGLLNSN
ncbi:MAG: hypothetical protein J6V50_03975 [Clostridia bacterium]|nr:hypothetical protein [Clostridia bacterium]